MNNSQKVWLETRAQEWAAKGWITAEAKEHICASADEEGEEKKKKQFPFSVSLYSAVAILGFSLLGIALIWGGAHVWYHISITARVVLAVILLVLSQLGVGAVMLQDKEGTMLAEGIGLMHCMAVFAALGIMEQTFYLGWSMAIYVLTGAVLCIPVMYLLRSLSCFIVYAIGVLGWAAAGGAMYMLGGSAFMWFLMVLAVPFYNVLVHRRDEKRLSVFSWIMTVTVFLAFTLSALEANYIPFLLLSALAVTVILTGYTIDIQKSWGKPFRWLGRIAAAISLLLSCLPGSWIGIADVADFHWTTTSMTVLLCAVSIGLMVKGVKKRLWGPAVYMGIPFLLGLETIVVRNGVYSSAPLVVSAVYVFGLGIYELSQGVRDAGRSMHLKLGVLILAGLVIAFFYSNTMSVLTPIAAIIVLTLVAVQLRQTRQARKAAAMRTARRSQWKHTHTVVHEETVSSAAANVPPVPEEEELLPEWMKDIQIPSVQAVQTEELPSHHQDTVIPREMPSSLFVAPVFHDPDAIPVVDTHVPVKPAVQPANVQHKGGSPWKTMAETETKRKKHFTQSPWSRGGGSKQ